MAAHVLIGVGYGCSCIDRCRVRMSMSLLGRLERRLRWRAAAVLVLASVGLALVWGDGRTYAHGNLAAADPPPNSSLDAPPARVTIWFTEPIEPSMSSIRVLDSEGRRVDNDDSAADPNDPTVMFVTLHPQLPDGTYTVGWRNLSTIDGHSIRGTYFFSVGEPLSEALVDAEGEPLLQSAAEPIMRWIVLLGGLSAMGSLMLWMVVLRPALGQAADMASLAVRARGRVYFLVLVGIVVALIGSVGHLLTQAASIYEVSVLDAFGEPVRFVLSETDWGRGWLRRAALFIGAVGPTLALLRLRKTPSVWRDTALEASAFLVAAMAMLTVSMTSHAAATTGIEFAATATDYVHMLAASFWVGGIFGLAVVLPVVFSHAPQGRIRDVVMAFLPRFSVVAVICFCTLAVTGLYSAWAQVTILPALVVPYGLTLLAKTALIVVLLALGAANLLWLTPAIRQNRAAASLIRWTITAEAVIGVFVVLASGYLTSLEPARQVASRQGIGVSESLTFHDVSEGVNVQVDVEPGQVGANEVMVSLTDRRGAAMTSVTGVDVRLTYLDADLGEEFLSAEDSGQGRFVASEVPVNIAGPYQMEIAARRTDGFDVRAAFRFEARTVGGFSSSSIFPSEDTGQLLFGIELAVLGSIFLAVGVPLGGWQSRRGSAVMGLGLAGFVAGAVIVFAAQSGGAADGERNPFLPNSDSLAVGSEVYSSSCATCHGQGGRGDGPAAAGLDPPPADLIVHVPLHSDRALFDFIRDGIEGTAMVGLGDRYTDEQIWHVVNYIKILE